MADHRAGPRPVHQEGRAAADGGQLRAGRGAAAGGPGLGRRPPTACSGLSAAPGGRRTPGWCSVRARYAAGRSRPRCCARPDRSASRLAALGSDDAAQAHLLAGRVALDLGRRADADRHLARPPAAGGAVRRWPGPAAGSAGRCARGGGRLAPAAGRVPPRARGPRRAPAHARRLGAARPGHRARRRAGRARAAARGAGGPAPAAAGLERAVAGDRAGGPAGAAAGRRGAHRRTRRAARGDEPAGDGAAAGSRTAALRREQQRLEPASAPARCGPAASRHRPPRQRVAELLDELGPAQLIEIVDIDGLCTCWSARRGGAAVHRGPDRRCRPGGGLRAVRAAPPGPRPARRRPGQRAGHPGQSGSRLEQALLGPAAGRWAAARSSSSRRAGCTPSRGR